MNDGFFRVGPEEKDPNKIRREDYIKINNNAKITADKKLINPVNIADNQKSKTESILSQNLGKLVFKNKVKFIKIRL